MLQFSYQNLARRLRRATARNHRCPLILIGDNNQLKEQLDALFKMLVQESDLLKCTTSFFYTDQLCWAESDFAHLSTIKITSWARANKALGQSVDLLIADLSQGISADGLGIVSGTVSGGGLIIMLCPPACQWPQGSPFHQRASRILTQFQDQLNANDLTAIPYLEKEQEQEHLPPTPYATADQQNAVAAIKRVKTGHRRRPLVLTADRGRGKSAALGIAAAELMQAEAGLKIVVTAPALATAATLFSHAVAILPECEQSRGLLRYNSSQIVFMAPDELAQANAQTSQGINLVLVDEAAALPAPLLTKLLKHHARIVFASTIHGYEGTGRGFAIRFQKTLDQLTPKWRKCQLQQPIRWAPADPLEQLINQLLLLDSDPVVFTEPAQQVLANVRYQSISKQQLSNNEQLLSQVFGLLVAAHYQTHPDNLQQLMDRDDLELVTLMLNGNGVAAMLVSYEGGFDALLAEQVWAGNRRLKGHLLPQTLATHAGHKRATTLNMARIMRLAVHPQLQGKGLGQRLVREFIAAVQGHVDIIGSCFGATKELLNFWQLCHLQPVHVGSTRNAASGCYNTVVILPISAGGETLYQDVSKRFQRMLPILARQTLTAMESEILLILLANSGLTMPFTPSDRRQLQAFVEHNLAIDRVLPELEALLLTSLPKYCDALPESYRNLLVCRFLQNRPWPEAIAESGIIGIKAAEEAVRISVQKLLSQSHD